MNWRSNETRKTFFEVLDTQDEVIAFDVETSGLNPEKYQIIQFSALKLAVVNGELQEIDELDIYIYPEKPISQKIMDLTGITNVLLASKGIPEKEAKEKIEAFVGPYPCLCAYNSSFDISFVSALYARHGSEFVYQYDLDALKMARDLIDKENAPKDDFNKPTYKLSKICHYYGVDDGIHFHSAIDDVRAMTKLLNVFIEEYKKVIPHKGELKPFIKAISYDKGFRGNSRIYVTTDRGCVFYSLYDKHWGDLKDTNIVEHLDMEYIQQECLRATDSRNMEEFQKFKGSLSFKKEKNCEGTRKVTVKKIAPWSNYGKERIYIDCEFGSCYFDFSTKKWYSKNISSQDFDDINITELEKDIREICKLNKNFDECVYNDFV